VGRTPLLLQLMWVQRAQLVQAQRARSARARWPAWCCGPWAAAQPCPPPPSRRLQPARCWRSRWRPNGAAHGPRPAL